MAKQSRGSKKAWTASRNKKVAKARLGEKSISLARKARSLLIRANLVQFSVDSVLELVPSSHWPGLGTC